MQKSNNNSINFSASDISKNIGLTLMSLAMTFGMVEVSTEHSGPKVVAHSQPAFAAVAENVPGDQSTQRNERLEAGPHYVSYSAAQRTPPRTGLV